MRIMVNMVLMMLAMMVLFSRILLFRRLVVLYISRVCGMWRWLACPGI